LARRGKQRVGLRNDGGRACAFPALALRAGRNDSGAGDENRQWRGRETW
jgi:hypothetical protein